MHPMKQHLRHYFGPYGDGVDYFVFVCDHGSGIRWEHVNICDVTIKHLEEADVAFKLPSGAFAVVDEFISGKTPQGAMIRHFTYEVHRSRDMQKLKLKGDIPLAQMEMPGGGDPPPSGCSAICGGSPYMKLDCPPGTRAACLPSNTGIECVRGEG